MVSHNRFAVLTLCALAGSALSLVLPRHAVAADSADVTVSYQDLDLSRSADARVLYGRLQRAAESVCGAPSRYELVRYAAFQRCVQVTLGDAVARIRSPELEHTLADLNRAGSERPSSDQTRR